MGKREKGKKCSQYNFHALFLEHYGVFFKVLGHFVCVLHLVDGEKKPHTFMWP